VSLQELDGAVRARAPQRATVWTLGLGAFGLAFALTTLTYLPAILGRFTESESLIALVLGAEGVFALLLSPVIGPWSDTFHTPLGRRRPFMVVALGPMAFCLALVAFMPSLWTAALIVFAFFFAYYVYESPYRGLYPDLLEPASFGRAQSVQHALRGVALAGALVGGGFLLDVWRPFPFLIAALVTTLACGAVVVLVREDGGHGRVFRGFRAYLAMNWEIVREDREVRRFLLANAAWEGTFAAMRIFVVLYVTKGLDQPARVASVVLAVVAGGYVVAAVASGPLGDRVGLARIIFAASWIYGLGLLAGGLVTQWHTWYYALSSRSPSPAGR
jgi:MFS family permease